MLGPTSERPQEFPDKEADGSLSPIRDRALCVPDGRVRSGIHRVLTDNLRPAVTSNMPVSERMTIQFQS